MTAPDLYAHMGDEDATLDQRRAAIETIVSAAASYGWRMARGGYEAPDLTYEWSDGNRVQSFDKAVKRRRWWCS
jgi:hypothetical protein